MGRSRYSCLVHGTRLPIFGRSPIDPSYREGSSSSLFLSLTPQLLFILISSAFLLFDGFGASMKRRKYEIIMIIMSHFARNNMVEALARFVGLITSDAIACHPRIRLSGSSPFRIYPILLPLLSLAFPSRFLPSFHPLLLLRQTPLSIPGKKSPEETFAKKTKTNEKKRGKRRGRRRKRRKNWVNEALIALRF